MLDIDYPLLTDGGLSNEIERQGANIQHSLWTARLLDTNPEAIIKAHLAYLNAGARCILTSSYQANIPGFVQHGYTVHKAEDLILKSVELASKAIDRFNNLNQSTSNILIGASIGPYGAYLANGSEYSGNYGVTQATLHSFHESKIKLLADSKADFLAIETIPSFEEAQVINDILKMGKKPSWAAFSCKNSEQINDGTSIEKCVRLFQNNKNVFAVGINCTPAQFVPELIVRIKKHSRDKRVVVYPNSGLYYNAETKEWTGISDSKSFTAQAQTWMDCGADIIGGCCTVGPTEIAAMQKAIVTQN